MWIVSARWAVCYVQFEVGRKKNEINFSFINVEKCKKIIINYVKILRQ